MKYFLIGGGVVVLGLFLIGYFILGIAVTYASKFMD